MSIERFDHVARMLAQGVSRRQILKGFAAGLGASLFSAIGLAGTPAYQRMAHAAPNADSSFLPLVIGQADVPSICAVASTCDAKVQCSTNRNECRCLESAEGLIRCGEVPSCSVQRCTSSADCANLGEGYFCDSVGSGCCGDDEQRCIAPCKTEAPCPEELLCGPKCCPPNATCQNGVCVDPVEGTWTGTLIYEGQSIGVRYILAQRVGNIEGRFLMEDPVSKEYLETGPVTGYYGKSYSTLFLESDSYAFGDFEGDSFTGEFTFASFNNEERLTATLALARA